jgi:transposase InsO family protein
LARQRERREAEREIRVGALVFTRWSRWLGVTRAAAAERLGLSARTLRNWELGWKRDRLRLKSRGRPVQRSGRELRNLVIAMFRLMGPGVGLPTLAGLFPELGRRELEELQRRYREVHLQRSSMLVHVLRWQRAGVVWAMDHLEPPTPVDGIYGEILVVRDLASGEQLMSLPVATASGRSTRDGLESLFHEHGPPLVIKSDNGPALTAREVRQTLADYGVRVLLSPPGTPSYNGSCEAGIGSLRTRAHHESARHDRPGEWTCDDVEGARLMANQTARPWGAGQPTPEAAWTTRIPLSLRERIEFAKAVENCQNEAREQRGCTQGDDLDSRTQASIDRVAISRALIASGYLELRRRRIRPPIKSSLWRKIA